MALKYNKKDDNHSPFVLLFTGVINLKSAVIIRICSFGAPQESDILSIFQLVHIYTTSLLVIVSVFFSPLLFSTAHTKSVQFSVRTQRTGLS